MIFSRLRRYAQIARAMVLVWYLVRKLDRGERADSVVPQLCRYLDRLCDLHRKEQKHYEEMDGVYAAGTLRHKRWADEYAVASDRAREAMVSEITTRTDNDRSASVKIARARRAHGFGNGVHPDPADIDDDE